MATLGEVVDYVLENVGKADAGEPRALVRQDIIDLLTVDLPSEVGGYLSQGIAELSVGYTASLQEDGVYALPATMRVCRNVLSLVDDVSITTPAKVTPFLSQHLYTDPNEFYYRFKWGAASSENPYGMPTSILVYGNEVHLRPIPKQAGSPLWFGKLVLDGSTVQDFTGADDSTVIEQTRLVPIVRAGATVLHAVRERRGEVAAMWGDIFNKRKSEARTMMASFAQNMQPAKDF